jgi:hypothetical protein
MGLGAAAFVLASLAGGVSYAEDATTSDATTSAANADDDETIVCRRIKDVGSLVSKKKICMTRAEWSKLSDSSKEFGREMNEARGVDTPTELIGPVGNQ